MKKCPACGRPWITGLCCDGCQKLYSKTEQSWFEEAMYEATHGADGKPLGSSKQEQMQVADPKLGLANSKPQPQYVPFALIAACSEALAEGRIKYGVSKWRETRTEAMTYVGAILRHLFAWIEGEEIDPESKTGKSHLAGATASLAILLDCIAAGTLVDNRPKAVGNAKLTREPK